MLLRLQAKQLFAISEDPENGLMQEMVTLTMNDSSAELIATVRRGPFAIPTDDERLEYLLSRKKTIRAPVEKHSAYHVLSYQRRVCAIKHNFFNREHPTPLGIIMDWWDSALASSQ